MNIKIINNEIEREQALSDFRRMSARENKTKEDVEKLKVISLLIKFYENNRFPIKKADPIELLKLTMDFRGIEPDDLIPVIGSKSHVYSILNGNRALSKDNAVNLSVLLNIPLEQLISDDFTKAVERLKKLKKLTKKIHTNFDYIGTRQLRNI